VARSIASQRPSGQLPRSASRSHAPAVTSTSAGGSSAWNTSLIAVAVDSMTAGPNCAGVSSRPLPSASKRSSTDVASRAWSTRRGVPTGDPGVSAARASSAPPRSPTQVTSSPASWRATRMAACRSRSSSTPRWVALPCSRSFASRLPNTLARLSSPERGVSLLWSSRSFQAARRVLTVAGNCSASQCSETRSLPTTIESKLVITDLRDGGAEEAVPGPWGRVERSDCRRVRLRRCDAG